MNKKDEDKSPDDPNELTDDDREVLNKRFIRPSDIRDALHDSDMKQAIVSSARSSERVFRILLGGLMVFTGIMIAVLTAVTLVGVLIGAVFIIGGILLPFSSLGAGRRDVA